MEFASLFDLEGEDEIKLDISLTNDSFLKLVEKKGRVNNFMSNNTLYMFNIVSNYKETISVRKTKKIVDIKPQKELCVEYRNKTDEEWFKKGTFNIISGFGSLEAVCPKDWCRPLDRKV